MHFAGGNIYVIASNYYRLGEFTGPGTCMREPTQ